MRNLLLIGLLLFCGAGCRQNSSSPDGTDAEAQGAPSSNNIALPAGFAEFYERFHADSSYQMAHISWPLAGNIQQDSTGEPVDLRYEPAAWALHTQPAQSAEFVNSLEAVSDGLVLEEIRARAGGFGIQRRFALLDGEWHLIYYEASVVGR